MAVMPSVVSGVSALAVLTIESSPASFLTSQAQPLPN
jgi:hypothetical protein